MPSRRFKYLLAFPFVIAVAAPVAAAPWWYVGHGADRVLFIDAGSIQRKGGTVTYSSKIVIRKPGDPVAMTSNFMRADCTNRRLGWLGVQQFGYDEAVIGTSTVGKAEMEEAPADTLAGEELGFVCFGAGDHEGRFFRLAIDDAAFTEALLTGAANGESRRVLHDRLAGNPATPVIRSTAPPTTSFGQVQTVKLGQPLVPPRDYEKGAQVPDPAAYPSNETGRIYDIAYQGIKDGQIQFEIRGYSIDDLVHPGSGQTETASLTQKKVNILDLAITIRKALPDRITYSVAIEKRAPVDTGCPADACDEEPRAMSAEPSKQRR